MGCIVQQQLSDVPAKPDNLAPARTLDVANDAHWDELHDNVDGLDTAAFDGVIMRA